MFSDSPPSYCIYPTLRSSLISGVSSDNARIENRVSTFERYFITKEGLAEGEETSKSFKVLFISLAKPQTENDSDTKPRIAHAFETLSKSG